MQIFISYKREDEAFARQLSGHIRGWGYESWLDVERITPGEIWDTAIDRGLRTSDVVVGVLTPESIASENVLNEWAWARSTDRPLIPLKLRDVPPDDFPHRYVRVQYIDFTRNQKAGLERLKTRLTNPATLYQSPTDNGQTVTPIVVAWAEEPKDNRGKMLKNVYDFWIQGVLDNVLRENEGFELRLDTAPGAVLHHRDFGNYTLPSSSAIEQVFEDMNRELLILGAPGAGKTILMLQLARQLIGRALQNEKLPMPVVFNLSSWVAERGALDEWLTRALQLNYNVPKKTAKAWVEQEKLLLLLDGLDEVATPYRHECVEKINEYKNLRRSVRLTVCSRIEGYEALTGKLDLKGAVVLKPLSEVQIQAYVSGEKLIGLRETMKTDGTLAEMAQTPFLLNSMATAYQEKSEVAFRLPVGAEEGPERRKHLFNAYVEYRLHGADGSAYSPADVRHHLTWLAKQMTLRQQSIYHIEGLQADWLPNKQAQRLVGLVLGLVLELLSLLVLGLIGVSVGVLTYGPAFGQTGALAGVLLSVLIFLGAVLGQTLGRGKTNPKVYSVETITVEIRKLVETLVISLFIGLVLGLIGGPAFGLIYGSLIGLIGGSVEGIRVSENVQSRTQPNEGMRSSAQNALRVAIVFGILVGLFGFIIGGIEQGMCVSPADQNTCGSEYFRWTLRWSNVGAALLFGPLAALAAGLWYGGWAVILHYTIRWLLWRRGSIPVNYVAFLDYAASLSILRKVGGGYIFIHRYLLEYFAGLEQD